jgi:hypothetical protein
MYHKHGLVLLNLRVIFRGKYTLYLAFLDSEFKSLASSTAALDLDKNTLEVHLKSERLISVSVCLMLSACPVCALCSCTWDTLRGSEFGGKSFYDDTVHLEADSYSAYYEVFCFNGTCKLIMYFTRAWYLTLLNQLM